MTDAMLENFERQFQSRISASMQGADSAHDLSHIRRVVKTAKELAQKEGGRMEVIVPAAWLHDLVTVPKSSPDRSRASQLSADAAVALLGELGYSPEHFAGIAHAIAAHSFSANLETKTLEAKIVQDADRLDALGAIGLARCFATGAAMGTSLYCEGDPFARRRELDDQRYSLDHLPKKLLRVAETMKTRSGAELARERADFLRLFLQQIESEVPAAL